MSGAQGHWETKHQVHESTQGLVWKVDAILANGKGKEGGKEGVTTRGKEGGRRGEGGKGGGREGGRKKEGRKEENGREEWRE